MSFLSPQLSTKLKKYLCDYLVHWYKSRYRRLIKVIVKE